MSSPPLIESVSRAFYLLECFERDSPLTLSELSRKSGFSLNRTFRLLYTLESLGYLSKDAHKRYTLSAKLQRLAEQAAWPFALIAAAAPALDALSSATGETVLLSVRSGLERLIVDNRESRYSLRVSYPVGSRVPLYVGGTGVVLLAYAPSEVLGRILSRPRHPFTPHTLVAEQALLASLEDVRQRGVRVSCDDYALGEFSVAAPILDAQGVAHGALCVAGFRDRLDTVRTQRYSDMVQEVAREISGSL